MRTYRFAAAWLVVVAGCAVGTRPAKFRPAQEPAGVEGRLALQGRREPLVGELLAVRDTGFVLLVQSRVTLVLYPVIRAAEFPQVGSFYVSKRAPDSEIRERLRRVSRFPQGVSPDLEERLLTAYNQPSLDVIQP